MSVALATPREVARIRLVAIGAKHSSGGAVAGDAIALQIGKMRWERCQFRTVARDARFDHNAAGMGGQAVQRREARRAPVAEGATPLSARGRMMQTARLLRGGQHSRDEAPCSSRLRRADTARPDTNVVVTQYDEAQTR